jgi:hypothetical protein
VELALVLQKVADDSLSGSTGDRRSRDFVYQCSLLCLIAGHLLPLFTALSQTLREFDVV